MQEKDFILYRQIIIKNGVLLVALLSCFLLLCGINQWSIFPFVLGLWVSVILSSLNMLALGLAVFELYIKNGSHKAILWPLASFLLLCLAALVLVFLKNESILGFAFGLSSPLILALIAWLKGKPA